MIDFNFSFATKKSTKMLRFLSIMLVILMNQNFVCAQNQEYMKQMYEKRKQEQKEQKRQEKEARKGAFSKNDYDKALAEKENEDKRKKNYEWMDRKYYPYNTKKVIHGITWGWIMGRDVVGDDDLSDVFGSFSPRIGYLVDFNIARHFYIESGVETLYTFETTDEATKRALELRIPVLFNVKARHFKFVFGAKLDYTLMYDSWYIDTEHGYDYETHSWPIVYVKTKDLERKYNVSPFLLLGWDIKRFSFGFSAEYPVIDNSHFFFPAIGFDFGLKF